MHLRLSGLALALLAVPALGHAQTPAPAALTPAAQLLKEGIALHDEEKFEEASARYQLVLPGDSAYALAQAELALSLMAAGKYQESIAAVQRSRALEPFEPELYATLGSDYEGLKQVAEARQAYATGLKLFPYNDNLWLNQGIFEVNQHQLAAGLASLQRATELRPDKGSGHRLLGIAAAQQGQLAHAMLSLAVFLAIEPTGPRSNAVLVDLERLSEGVPMVDKADQVAPVAANAAFEELDQLLAGKVALSDAYVSKVKFKAALVKQVQLLVEKFPVEADPASDFWVRIYAPLVRVLRQDDNLTAFTYLILSSAEDKSAQQWAKSNKSRVDKLVAALVGPLLAVRDHQPLAGSAAPVAAWYTDEPRLEGLGAGERDAKGDVLPTGPWVLLAKDGSIRQRGTYSAAHQRTGKWLLLRPDGSTEAEQQYANGELDGVVRYYHPGGQLKHEATYQAGKLTGQSKSYSPDGRLSETRQFANNDYEGDAIDYHPNGQPSRKVGMHADQRQGTLEHFYPDGTLEQRGTFAQGKAQGEMLVYYPDKTLEKKMVYDQDELHGPYTSYFANGQVEETGQYTRGKRTGAWRTYFANGKPSVEETYDDNGELHGAYHDYDWQGRHYSDSQYEHGRLVRATSLDAAGKPRADFNLKKGRVAVKAYDAEGRLSNTGEVENGHLVGEWKNYFPEGAVREVHHYNDKGELTGVSETYYATGQLRQRRHYGAGGQYEGYFEQYYPDGQLQQTGYEAAGQDEGVWKSYYPTGQLSQERQLFRGELSGPMRSYTPGGKLAEERLYAYGRLRQLITHDSTGQVVDRLELTPASKEAVTHYPGLGHQVLNRAALADGLYEGTSTWLLPGGQPESTLLLHDGKRYGPYRTQYPGGQTEAEGQYLNGRQHGQFTAYYADGTPSSRGRYLNGEPVGEWTYYFPNGKPQRVQQYSASGDLDGPSRFYNPAGELLVEHRYDQGRLVGFAGPVGGEAQALPLAGGPVKTSFATGKPAADEVYAHGYPSGPSTYYYASGQVFRRVAYQKGVRSGPLVSYWPSGKPMEEESYLHGELHGRCRYYRPDGTLEREENYRAGERSGPSSSYDAQGRPQRTVYYWNNVGYNPR